MDRAILIIDDTNQENEFNSLIYTPLKAKGTKVVGICIKTDNRQLQDDEYNIDLDKLIKHIQDKIKGIHIDLILSDFNLSDDNVTGLEVIAELRKFKPKTPIILYSGTLSDAVSHILGEDVNNKSTEDIIQGVSTLLKYGIVDFVKRTNYFEAAIRHIKEDTDDATSYLLHKLREHGAMQFKSVYDPFKGRTLIMIADEIEKRTSRGRDFEQELLEQSIAYLVRINEDE